MTTQTIEQFFTGKTLIVPSYQRDYAWSEGNIDDLFEDIDEAMQLSSSHYLGAFILSQTSKMAPVHVVDGQQRLTTLTMLLNALVEAVEEQAIQDHYRGTYVTHPVYGRKFTVLGVNTNFFKELLENKLPIPVSDGQQRLLKAYQWIKKRVSIIKQEGGNEAVKSWLLCISHLEVLEFTEKDEGKAIRMFQSVNDRGVPLAKMDIAKSLLIYYSNRFLDGKLDSYIADRFGEAFRSFSRLKKMAAEDGYQIRVINREPFKEDDILRYHYFAFDCAPHGLETAADYNATAETVLESFLKPFLKSVRSDDVRLSNFIRDYVEDLASFFRGLLELVEKVRHEPILYMLFVVQDLSATLYPLIIRAYLANRLDEQAVNHGSKTLLELIELADIRVFKLQGTNPQADMAWLVRNFNSWDIDAVANHLFYFCQRFMPTAKFQARLSEDYMYRNPGLLRILLEAENDLRRSLSIPDLGISELAALLSAQLTIEHILPQEASFGVKMYGFHSEDSYREHVDLLGNLAPLEKKVNSACSNSSAETKTQSKKMYRASSFQLIQKLAAEGAGKTPAFSKKAIVDRGARIAAFAVQRWPLP